MLLTPIRAAYAFRRSHTEEFRMFGRSLFSRVIGLTAASLLAVFISGCEELLNQIQASNVALATLVSTPDQPNPLDSTKTIKGRVGLQVFFGAIDQTKIAGSNPGSGAFTPTAGATVTVSYTDPSLPEGQREVSVAVEDKGEGKYFVDSVAKPTLKYVEDAKYTLTIVSGGKTFKMETTAPKKNGIKEFETNKVIKDHPAGTPFTVTRTTTSTNGDPNDIAFVAMGAVSGETSSEAYTNAPKDPMGMLKLALDPTPYQAPSFTIPGDKFEANNGYLVTLSSFKQNAAGSTPSGSDALFISSKFLVGTADAGAIATPKAP